MSVPELVIGTQNRDKGTEIFARLAHLPVRLRGMWEWSDADPVEETGQTLRDNALLKAEAAATHTRMWAIADDTGLEVDALNGSPGVYSARFAGPKATYSENRQKLLNDMINVPLPGRGARFTTVIALVRPGVPPETMTGSVEGVITYNELGEGGFGYDSIFCPAGNALTFAQMTVEEKNRISHRGLAMEALVRRLEDLL